MSDERCENIESDELVLPAWDRDVLLKAGRLNGL